MHAEVKNFQHPYHGTLIPNAVAKVNHLKVLGDHIDVAVDVYHNADDAEKGAASCGVLNLTLTDKDLARKVMENADLNGALRDRLKPADAKAEAAAKPAGPKKDEPAPAPEKK